MSISTNTHSDYGLACISSRVECALDVQLTSSCWRLSQLKDLTCTRTQAAPSRHCQVPRLVTRFPGILGYTRVCHVPATQTETVQQGKLRDSRHRVRRCFQGIAEWRFDQGARRNSKKLRVCDHMRSVPRARAITGIYPGQIRQRKKSVAGRRWTTTRIAGNGVLLATV